MALFWTFCKQGAWGIFETSGWISTVVGKNTGSCFKNMWFSVPGDTRTRTDGRTHTPEVVVAHYRRFIMTSHFYRFRLLMNSSEIVFTNSTSLCQCLSHPADTQAQAYMHTHAHTHTHRPYANSLANERPVYKKSNWKVLHHKRFSTLTVNTKHIKNQILLLV